MNSKTTINNNHFVPVYGNPLYHEEAQQVLNNGVDIDFGMGKDSQLFNFAQDNQDFQAPIHFENDAALHVQAHAPVPGHIQSAITYLNNPQGKTEPSVFDFAGNYFEDTVQLVLGQPSITSGAPAVVSKQHSVPPQSQIQVYPAQILSDTQSYDGSFVYPTQNSLTAQVYANPQFNPTQNTSDAQIYSNSRLHSALNANDSQSCSDVQFHPSQTTNGAQACADAHFYPTKNSNDSQVCLDTQLYPAQNVNNPQTYPVAQYSVQNTYNAQAYVDAQFCPAQNANNTQAHTNTQFYPSQNAINTQTHGTDQFYPLQNVTQNSSPLSDELQLSQEVSGSSSQCSSQCSPVTEAKTPPEINQAEYPGFAQQGQYYQLNSQVPMNTFNAAPSFPQVSYGYPQIGNYHQATPKPYYQTGQYYTFINNDGSKNLKQKKKTSTGGGMYTKQACTRCKNSHIACCDIKPCYRCTRLGYDCEVASVKKRGRRVGQKNKKSED